jgi:predicted Rossmann fold flavoprotein
VRIAIIGGGAAGFFGAISAKTHNPSVEVVIFEATHQLLEKVLLSGGGRCNVTHACFDPAELVKNYPRGHRELRGPFTRFQPQDTVDWFESHGVKLKVESDGRMFPVTDSSSTIADCLINTAGDLGIEIRLDARVKEIKRVADGGGDQFEIESHGRANERFDRVMLATGSAHQGYRFAEHLGHTIVPCVPSLFTFKVSDRRLEGLSGISFDSVHLTLTDDSGNKLEQSGPLLITHWGLSGPAVLKLSAWGARMLHDCNYHASLEVNFLPKFSAEQLYEELVAYRDKNGKRHIATENGLRSPLRFWRRIVETVGISEETIWAHLSKEEMHAIIVEYSRGQYAIRGKGIFKEEFVTCGGVDLREVDFKTMQSKLSPGLHFGGEILDIDGITGGFNFQSAWTTGWIAGMSMAETTDR